MTSESVECAVVGGGIVGVAIARELAAAGREVVLLEAESALGTHTSSRNSEVIHAGLYHPPETLKASLCVRGRELLYRFCEEHGVAHRRIGKLIVAVDEAERATLAAVADRARRCGVDDLRALSAADVRALEPAVAAVAGLLSPSTGIVDSHALLRALRADAERVGAVFMLESRVMGGAARPDGGVEIEVAGAQGVSAARTRLSCRAVVNAAGHGAIPLARSLAGVAPSSLPRPRFAVGHYFLLRGASPFQRLVYPVPQPGSLGVHATLDLQGSCRFGPDLQYLDEVDYRFDESRAPAFYAAVRRYFPSLPDGALAPGHTGVRPKLHGPDEPAADFRIDGVAVHGVAGLVNVFGIESPGLTAALAIAERVRASL